MPVYAQQDGGCGTEGERCECSAWQWAYTTHWAWKGAVKSSNKPVTPDCDSAGDCNQQIEKRRRNGEYWIRNLERSADRLEEEGDPLGWGADFRLSASAETQELASIVGPHCGRKWWNFWDDDDSNVAASHLRAHEEVTSQIGPLAFSSIWELSTLAYADSKGTPIAAVGAPFSDYVSALGLSVRRASTSLDELESMLDGVSGSVEEIERQVDDLYRDFEGEIHTSGSEIANIKKKLDYVGYRSQDSSGRASFEKLSRKFYEFDTEERNYHRTHNFFEPPVKLIGLDGSRLTQIYDPPGVESDLRQVFDLNNADEVELLIGRPLGCRAQEPISMAISLRCPDDEYCVATYIGGSSDPQYDDFLRIWTRVFNPRALFEEWGFDCSRTRDNWDIASMTRTKEARYRSTYTLKVCTRRAT